MIDARKKEVYSWLKSVVIALIIALIIRGFVFMPVLVSGKSMEPTFHHGDRVVITKIHKLEHFDMIVFHAPDAKSDFIKRVVGLPGDVVAMKDDILYINGEAFTEDYLFDNKQQIFQGQKLTEDFEEIVPDGYLYVLGDNRRNSNDSRDIGFIEREAVVGEVKFRIFPLKEIGVPK